MTMLFAMTLTAAIHAFVTKVTLVLETQEIALMKMNVRWGHMIVMQRLLVPIPTVDGNVLAFILLLVMELFARFQSRSKYSFPQIVRFVSEIAAFVTS